MKIPGALSWDERAVAYDEWISAQRAAKRAQAKIAIEDDELTDYERELKEWRRRYELLALSPDGLGVFELAALFKLRKDIADLGRRAVGLPEKFTEGKLEHKFDQGGLTIILGDNDGDGD